MICCLVTTILHLVVDIVTVAYEKLFEIIFPLCLVENCVYLREKVDPVKKEMSAVNFLAHSSLGAFPAAGDQQLPWLPVEEGPDLLDRLIQVPE